MDRIDLHTHTNFSDGTLSPTELVRLAKESGVGCLAITDHDTIDGVAEALVAGKTFGVAVIGGCELSAMTEYGELHILGLWVTPCKALLDMLSELRGTRARRNQAMLARLNDLGISLSMEEVRSFAGQGSIGRPHIAQALQARGLVQSVRQAFERYIGAGCPAFVPKESPSPEALVQRLSASGAVVSLAHPFLHHYPNDWLYQRIQSLQAHGLDALEAWHSEHSPEQSKQCRQWAERLGLALTGGSDFHGTTKPGVFLGVGRHNLCLGWDLLQALEAIRVKKQGR
ncbi:MAG: PHP domain-containing protein [Desulfovibrio sp.]|nr:PHP domain-containing protein [Desulfovibrio sp.]